MFVALILFMRKREPCSDKLLIVLLISLCWPEKKQVKSTYHAMASFEYHF